MTFIEQLEATYAAPTTALDRSRQQLRDAQARVAALNAEEAWILAQLRAMGEDV